MTVADAGTDDAVEQLLDLLVYAPIGLVAMGLEALPELAEKGRAQASTAKVVGQFATTVGSRQVRDRLSGVEAQIAEVLSIVREAASPSRRTTPAPNDDASTSGRAETREAMIETVIPGYDDLAATAIMPLLTELEIEQLAIVEQYERDGRARRTVLTRIAQRRSALGR